MRVKIGDHVRFLNDVGEGTVSKVVDNHMVEVMTTDGWAIPTLISELIVIPGSDQEEPFRPEPSPVVFHNPQKQRQANHFRNTDAEIVLLAVRDSLEDQPFSGLRWYLVNDSGYALDFAFYNQVGGEVHLIERDNLDPGTKIFLQELPSTELTKIQGFHIQGMLSHSDSKVLPPLVSAYIPLVIKKFSAPGAYQENDYLHEHAMLFDVRLKPRQDDPVGTFTTEGSDAPILKKSDLGTAVTSREPREIDLHINMLVDKVVGLSNREIIRIQMAVFERELNKAITDRERSIVFIHGIGNGTLKETLRKTIESDYAICSYEDASFREYGFGATLVLIRQNR